MGFYNLSNERFSKADQLWISFLEVLISSTTAHYYYQAFMVFVLILKTAYTSYIFPRVLSALE